jgi:hypothetical protein
MYSYTGVDRPLGLQDVVAPRINRKSVHEDCKDINPMHRAPLPPEDIRGTHFC